MRRTSIAVFAALCFAASAAPGTAGQLDDRDAVFALIEYGTELMTAGETLAAFRVFEDVSRRGHGDTSFYLATHFERGLAVDQDFAEAARLFRLASEQGAVIAELWLGRLYLDGRGVEKDAAEAHRWFRRAATWLTYYPTAAENYFLASMSLGWTYVPDAVKEEIRWMRGLNALAPAAQYALGLRYRDGEGVDADPLIAAHLLRRAAEAGLVAAQYDLAQALLRPHACLADPDEGPRWLHEAAKAGVSAAQVELGRRYEHGDGVEPSLWKAYSWLWWARRNGAPVVEDLVRVGLQLTPTDRADVHDMRHIGLVPDL